MGEKNTNPLLHTSGLGEIGLGATRDEIEDIIGLNDGIEGIDCKVDKELSPDIIKCEKMIWEEISKDKVFFENLLKKSLSTRSIEQIEMLTISAGASIADVEKWRNRKDIKVIRNLLHNKIVEQLNKYNLKKGYKPLTKVYTDINFETERSFQIQVFVDQGFQRVTLSLVLEYDHIYGYDCQSLEVVNLDQYKTSVLKSN